MKALLRLITAATGLLAGAAMAAPCSVPGSHASVALALADANCDPINIAAGDFVVSASVSRPVAIAGAGSAATRLHAGQPGISVFTLAPTANLTLEGLQLLVDAGTPAAMAVSQQPGAQLEMSDVGIGNAVPPAAPLVFANGFE